MLLRFHCIQAYERFQQTARIGAYPRSLEFAFVFRLLFPYGLSVTSGPIRETFAHDSFQRQFGAMHVVYAEANAVAIAEIKFREIAMQMLFCAMLIDSL